MKIVRRLLALFVLIPLLTLVTAPLFGFLFDLIVFGGSWNSGGGFFWNPGYLATIFVVGLGPAFLFWIFFFLAITRLAYDYIIATPFVGFGIWWQLKFGYWQLVTVALCATLGFYLGTLVRKKTEKILKRKINP